MLHVYSASPAAAMLSCLKKVESGCLNEFYEREILLRSRNVTNENMLHTYIQAFRWEVFERQPWQKRGCGFNKMELSLSTRRVKVYKGSTNIGVKVY